MKFVSPGANAAAVALDEETVRLGQRIRRIRGEDPTRSCRQGRRHPRTIHGVERGRRTPTLKTLTAIAAALGCTLDDLVVS